MGGHRSGRVVSVLSPVRMTAGKESGTVVIGGRYEREEERGWEWVEVGEVLAPKSRARELVFSWGE